MFIDASGHVGGENQQEVHSLSGGKAARQAETGQCDPEEHSAEALHARTRFRDLYGRL
jgi:hypothetical protein